MFTRAFEACKADENIKINDTKSFEWAMTNAGDYALEFTLWIYLERIPSTKITSRLRQHLMGTIYKINEAVYTASVIENIDLSTPDVISAQISSPPVVASPLNEQDPRTRGDAPDNHPPKNVVS